ncbi:MAG: DUF4870 domain-containing protein [Prosthecobacter sp.]|nr:DUF4870 domain-containing protein [Prosthecobacter sp.]
MESTPLPPDGNPPPPAVEPSKDEKNMAMLTHLLALGGLVVPFPGGNIIGPLILWLIKKDTMPFVDYHGKEALNFNITVAIAAAICFVTFWLILPIILLIGVGIAWLVFTIIAAIQTSEGKHYRYPFTLRLVK